MRFCPWYALSAAGDHAPAEEGVLQVRVEHGLLDYPRGKSAMVWYGHAPDMQARARTIATELAASSLGPLLCRHTIESEPATDMAAFCAKLREEFVRRFGTPPVLEPDRVKP